jgi:hypothetical protein
MPGILLPLPPLDPQWDPFYLIDEPKPARTVSDFILDANLGLDMWQTELNKTLLGPHQAVTVPTSPAAGPSGTAPSDPNYTSPTDDEIDPSSDRGSTMWDSGSGGGGGGSLPDLEGPGMAAD